MGNSPEKEMDKSTKEDTQAESFKPLVHHLKQEDLAGSHGKFMRRLKEERDREASQINPGSHSSGKPR